MKESEFLITENVKIAKDTYRLVLSGDISEIKAPGQFVNIELPGFFLRRPISVCDVELKENAAVDMICNAAPSRGITSMNGTVTLLYKLLGNGTRLLSTLPTGTRLNVLTGLGNGFDESFSGKRPLLIGGGIGCAPMLYLAKQLLKKGRPVTAVLGFNSKDEVILNEELSRLNGVRLIIVTRDGSLGEKGVVTDAVRDMDYSFFYACGPKLMLKAVCDTTAADGEISLEERFGCGFGVCVGCSTKTLSGVKRVCRDGPVFKKRDIIWED